MDLSLNRIQDEGCFALANAWPGNTCLSELRLHGNDITPVGKRAFGAALLSSDTNCLQYASWNEWALIPETTKFLRSGSTPVRGNTHQKRPKLQVADAMVLSNCFARTSNVIELDISNNTICGVDARGAGQFDPVGVNALLSALVSDGCRMSGVGCRASGVGCRVSGVGLRPSDR